MMINYYININNILIISVGLCISIVASAQDQISVQQAQEYVLHNENKKAVEVYDQLIKKGKEITLFHNDYLHLLLKMQLYSKAKQYIEKRIKEDQNNIQYKLDEVRILYNREYMEKAEKYFSSLLEKEFRSAQRLQYIIQYFTNLGMYNYAEKVIKRYRKFVNNNLVFAIDLAKIYRIQKRKKDMIYEYVNHVEKYYVNNVDRAMIFFGNLLSDEQEWNALEQELMNRVQKNPNSAWHLYMLILSQVKQKEFYEACLNAQAYDMKFNEEDSKTLEVVATALENGDNDNALFGINRVMNIYSEDNKNYIDAIWIKIKIQEKKLGIKEGVPIDKDEIQSLILSYQRYIDKYPQGIHHYEAILNQSKLYAYYLKKKERSIQLLNEILKSKNASHNMQGLAMIELGDIYMLYGEPWEATLLYSKVERTHKNTSVGERARLRNAKKMYYEGNFTLAQETLDIIKQATTKKIANDAMELSLKIKDNMVFDSTGHTLKKYAEIEMLLSRHQTEKALHAMTLLKKDIEHLAKSNTDGVNSKAILDDLYFLEAKIRLRRKEWQQAEQLLQNVIDDFGEDVLADDAYFLQGDIAQHNNQNDKAKDKYFTLLKYYPTSIHATEARKRYRHLRGDIISVN